MSCAPSAAPKVLSVCLFHLASHCIKGEKCEHWHADPEVMKKLSLSKRHLGAANGLCVRIRENSRKRRKGKGKGGDEGQDS